MLSRIGLIAKANGLKSSGSGISRSLATAVQSSINKKGLPRKVNPCYIPICDAKIYQPPRDTIELCKAGRFIVENYYPYEPILKANSIIPTSTMTNYYMEVAKNGILLYAIVEEDDQYEKLGLILGHPIPNKDAFEELNSLAVRIKHKGTRNYMQLLAELEKKKNIGLLYNTKKNLSLDVLVVHADLRRRQVSKMLLKSFIESAVKDEYDIIRFATSSDFATKAAQELGFKAIYSIEPEVLRNFYGELLAPNPLCSPHKMLKILVRDLRKEKKKPKD